jgi:hypothetical protein
LKPRAKRPSGGLKPPIGKSTIDVRIDTNGIEAQKMCVGFKAVLTQQNTYFGGAWTLRIFSPFSGEHPPGFSNASFQ